MVGYGPCFAVLFVVRGSPRGGGVVFVVACVEKERSSSHSCFSSLQLGSYIQFHVILLFCTMGYGWRVLIIHS